MALTNRVEYRCGEGSEGLTAGLHAQRPPAPARRGPSRWCLPCRGRFRLPWDRGAGLTLTREGRACGARPPGPDGLDRFPGRASDIPRPRGWRGWVPPRVTPNTVMSSEAPMPGV